MFFLYRCTPLMNPAGLRQKFDRSRRRKSVRRRNGNNDKPLSKSWNRPSNNHAHLDSFNVFILICLSVCWSFVWEPHNKWYYARLWTPQRPMQIHLPERDCSVVLCSCLDLTHIICKVILLSLILLSLLLSLRLLYNVKPGIDLSTLNLFKSVSVACVMYCTRTV